MEKTILVIGAGRSATMLIQYLAEKADENLLNITVADVDETVLNTKLSSFSKVKKVVIRVGDENQLLELIKAHKVVLSLVPPFLHLTVAKFCIANGVHCITPSYISKEMSALDQEAKNAGVLIMNEMGLDPGIDHMSAMKLIDEIRDKGGFVKSFESYTGGLIAPESDNNPWHYKLTWNPRNVILAGQGGTARFLQRNVMQLVPYNQLFKQITRFELPKLDLEGYANRDSVPYKTTYGLSKAHTVIRGTLRYNGFCESWNVLVSLGLTDDSVKVDFSKMMTYTELIGAYIPQPFKGDLKSRIQEYTRCSDETMELLNYLDLFSDRIIPLDSGSPADALLQLLLEKWHLNPEDKDMVVMLHRITYQIKDKEYEIQSSLQCIGDDSINTAMSKTVGFPMAILAELILEDKVDLIGVHVPVQKEIYTPVLEKLEQFGIKFMEK